MMFVVDWSSELGRVRRGFLKEYVGVLVSRYGVMVVVVEILGAQVMGLDKLMEVLTIVLPHGGSQA